jgi:hypothetical protein
MRSSFESFNWKMCSLHSSKLDLLMKILISNSHYVLWTSGWSTHHKLEIFWSLIRNHVMSYQSDKYSALRFIQLPFNRRIRFIRQKWLVPKNYLSLVMHLLWFNRLRFNRPIRIIWHKMSAPWSIMHCFYCGLFGFHFWVDVIFISGQKISNLWWVDQPDVHNTYILSLKSKFSLIGPILRSEVSTFFNWSSQSWTS